MQIRYPGLVEMPRRGTNHYFADQTPATGSKRHGNINNGISPSLRDQLKNVFNGFLDAIGTSPPFIGGETRFVIHEPPHWHVRN